VSSTDHQMNIILKLQGGLQIVLTIKIICFFDNTRWQMNVALVTECQWGSTVFMQLCQVQADF